MYNSHPLSARRFDDFGLESPFSQEAAVAPSKSGPANPAVARMLALPGRFDDPARDRAVEFDGLMFDEFLRGESTSAFSARWLAGRPGLAAAAGKPRADLRTTDIAKAWFVIHDVGVGASLSDDRYNAARLRKEEEDERRNAKNGVKGARPNGYPVHGFLNRLGNYAALHDFAESRSGTVFEFATKRGKQICLGRTINVETVPDVETLIPPPAGSPPPPQNADKYASIGHAVLTVERKIGGVKKRVKAFQYFKWTHEAVDVLADLYILASARAGHLLTVCAHKEMDRNLAKSVIWREHSAAEFRKGRASDGQSLVRARDKPSDYHGDPYAFDMQAFYDLIAKKLNALGGRQLPSGARFGVHPARLRKANGGNIGNLDGQKNTFPFQSSPQIERDRDLKEKGWWNTAPQNEHEEKDLELNPYEAGPEAIAEEDLSLSPCAWHEDGNASEIPSDESREQSFEGEPHCARCAGRRRAEEGLEEWDQSGAENLDWLEMEQASSGETPSAAFVSRDQLALTSESDERISSMDALFEHEPPSMLALREGGADGYETMWSEGESAGGSRKTQPVLARYIPEAKAPTRMLLLYIIDAKGLVGDLAVDMQGGGTASKGIEIGHFVLTFVEVFELVAATTFAAGALAVAAPLVGLAASLAALGSGYQEAAEEIAKRAAASGFSHGVVMGADGRKFSQLRAYFGNTIFPPNPFVPQGQKIETANYRLGLAAGFIQGKALSENQRANFWGDLSLRLGDQSYRGSIKQWSERDWIDWYITAGGAFRALHLAR